MDTVVDFYHWIQDHDPARPVTTSDDPRWWAIRDYVGHDLFDSTVHTRTPYFMGQYYDKRVRVHYHSKPGLKALG